LLELACHSVSMDVRTQREAEDKARALVNKWALAAGAVSWVPGSSFALGAADYAMIRAVAQTFNVTSYSAEAVVGIMAAAGTGKFALETLSFIPVAGWAVKAALSGGIMKGMGEAVIKYFRERSPLPVA
jgi:hypothetical protein